MILKDIDELARGLLIRECVCPNRSTNRGLRIMKFMKKLACAAAVAMSFAGAANAEVVLNDWVFNPAGTGFENGQTINEYLDVNGNAFIQLTPTGGNSFSFTEHAVFN